jgi:serine/threonine protein kinase
LKKLGGKLIKTWQQRYFFLKDGLLYWAKTKDTEVIKSITLDNAVVANAEKAVSKKYSFSISLPGLSKPYFLCCDSEADMLEWMEAIQSKPEDKVNLDDFDLLSVIGKGSFGKVMQVRKKDSGMIYAMKILRKDAIIARNQVRNAKAERAILQKMDHPFLVGLKFAFQTDDKLYLVLDYVNGGELFFHLQKERRFAEDRVRLYAAEIVLGLGFLHSKDIVYRDLKPENILLDSDGHVMLTDFGLCKEDMTATSETHTFCGSPEYLAPEILRGEGYGKAVDWWSLGTLVYEMLVGLPPFYSQNVNLMYEKILKGELKFPSHISAEAKRLLLGLLEREAPKRLGSSPADMDDNKQEPFFAGLDWDKIMKRGYKPAFKPAVKEGSADTSNFDEAFTSEKAIDSVVESRLSETAKKTSSFDGFTYVAPSAIQKSE